MKVNELKAYEVITDVKDLPEPKVYMDGHRLLMSMERKGKTVYERIPLHWLKMNDMQKEWYLANLGTVKKLFKKLNITYEPGDTDENQSTTN